MSDLTIRSVTAADLAACCALETACFPPDEAASCASIETRIAQYPQGFFVAERDGAIVGMVNSGATDRDDITDEAFKQLIGHDPGGANRVIFSLAVAPEARGADIGQRLLAHFITDSRDQGHQRVLLLCKTPLIAYYARAGFELIGESASSHGGAQWYEMVVRL